MPALLMRLLLSALLILNGSADAWAAASGLPAQAVGHDGHASPTSMPAHCANAVATRGHDAMVVAHDGGHAHHAGPQIQPRGHAAQPDCGGGQSCNHACHVPASSAPALPALLQPIAFERGQELVTGSDVLRGAPPPHQPIRPPIC